MTAMKTNQRFAELRALLLDPSTRVRAEALSALFEAWPAEASRDVARQYADHSLTKELGHLLEAPSPQAWAALSSLFDSFDKGESLTVAIEVAGRACKRGPPPYGWLRRGGGCRISIRI